MCLAGRLGLFGGARMSYDSSIFINEVSYGFSFTEDSSHLHSPYRRSREVFSPILDPKPAV